MRNLVELSLSHRLVVVLLAVLLIAAGWMSFRTLPIDAFPDVTNIQVTVISQAATLSPLEIEQLVTYPIEQACTGLPHSTEVRSLSKFGLSMVTVVFEDGTDIYFARQLVMERIFSVQGELPEGATSGLGPISTGLGEVYQYTLESPDLDLMELRSLQDWVLRPILRTVPGVAGVDSFGGNVRQFHVVADPMALRQYGLALEELAAAVAANNGVAGGAFVERGGEQFVVRGDGWLRNGEDLENTVVAYRNNVPVLLRQVAAVELAPEIRQGAISRDGRGETVAGIVLMLRGGSGRDVVAGVKEKLELARQSLPPGVEIVPFYDRNELVTTALGTVRGALFQGAVLVLLVLLFFMGHLRSAVLVALQLPMAALATFLVMGLFGMSLNLMTLSGLAIAVGMLGDGAIVLVENAVRLLARPQGAEQQRCGLMCQAATEVARPVTFGVLVIIVVFIPIAALQGMEGKMFAPLAYTIGIALGCSLLLTMTVIPVLASMILKPVPVFGGGRIPHPADVVQEDVPAPPPVGARPPVGRARNRRRAVGGRGGARAHAGNRVSADHGRGLDRRSAVSDSVGVARTVAANGGPDRGHHHGTARGSPRREPYRPVRHFHRSHGRRRERHLRTVGTSLGVDDRPHQGGTGRGDPGTACHNSGGGVRLYPTHPDAG